MLELKFSVSKTGAIDPEGLQRLFDSLLNQQKTARRLKNRKQDLPVTLGELIKYFLEISSKKIIEGNSHNSGRPISATTMMQYHQTQHKIHDYLKSRGITDIPIIELDKFFYDDFINFLMSLNLAKNTIGKHIKNLKAMIKSLPSSAIVNCEFIERGKCVKLEEEVNNVVLNEEEIRRIHDCRFTGQVGLVRDQFLLLCWTGCRYSDLDKLTGKNIEWLGTGKVFKFKQQKTGRNVTIPIFSEINPILEKYGYNPPQPLANHTFNRILKEVCREAGINDHVVIERTEGGIRVQHEFPKWRAVSAHTARRTFATNMYKRGIPTLAIMRLTGHTTEKSFLKYIKIDEDQNAMIIMDLLQNASKNT